MHNQANFDEKLIELFTSDIDWTCPECEKVNRQIVIVPELDFSAENSYMDNGGRVDISCGHCPTTYSGLEVACLGAF